MSDDKAGDRYEVGFRAEDASTRTTLLSNGLSSVWSDGDRIALWAYASDGSCVLSARQFATYARNGVRGWFTTTLDAKMPQDTYTYYATYPAPLSVDGTKARFSIPSVQDGRLGDGSDILMSQPVVYGPLAPLPEVESHDGMSMSMDHMLHHFRFFIPAEEDKLDGEAIEKLVVSFPGNVVGTLVADIKDRSVTLENGSSSLSIIPEEPFGLSTSEKTIYACAGFLPSSFSEGECLKVKLFTANRYAECVPVDLKGRHFAPGHSTPVRLSIDEVKAYEKLCFTIAANNLGEDIESVTLTAPQSCKWGNGLSSVFVYTPQAAMKVGDSFEIPFESVEAMMAFSKAAISVSYESGHATVSGSITMPELTVNGSKNVNLTVPYLFFEDFSALETFSSSDTYTGGFSSGSKAAVPFLTSWSGARVGGEAGTCVRLAARRETVARYGARMDSAPILGLKEPVDLVVRFDYGSDNRFSSSSGDVGQTCTVGYSTSEEYYASGSEEGVFETENSFTTSEKGGSYTNTPNTAEMVIHDAPDGILRITWITMTNAAWGASNTTNWLYVDNVRVSIATK